MDSCCASATYNLVAFFSSFLDSMLLLITICSVTQLLQAYTAFLYLIEELSLRFKITFQVHNKKLFQNKSNGALSD